jgi:hypothetical protein
MSLIEKTTVDYTEAAESKNGSQQLPKASLHWQGFGFRLLFFSPIKRHPAKHLSDLR